MYWLQSRQADFSWEQQLRAANKEVPPTPEPPTDSDDDEDLAENQAIETEKTDQDEVNSEPAVEKDKVEPSNKGKEVVDEAATEHVEVTSEEIFANCDSFEKV